MREPGSDLVSQVAVPLKRTRKYRVMSEISGRNRLESFRLFVSWGFSWVGSFRCGTGKPNFPSPSCVSDLTDPTLPPLCASPLCFSRILGEQTIEKSYSSFWSSGQSRSRQHRSRQRHQRSNSLPRLSILVSSSRQPLPQDLISFGIVRIIQNGKLHATESVGGHPGRLAPFTNTSKVVL